MKPIVYSKVLDFDQETQFVTQLEPVDMGDYIFVGLAVKTASGALELPENATDEQVKAYQILQASKTCKERIIAGFKSDCLGALKMFDCEMMDQATIQGLAITAMLGLQGFTVEETHWKAKGELQCYKFEYIQIIKLATDLKRHVESNVNQFNAERLAILSETIN